MVIHNKFNLDQEVELDFSPNGIITNCNIIGIKTINSRILYDIRIKVGLVNYTTIENISEEYIKEIINE